MGGSCDLREYYHRPRFAKGEWLAILGLAVLGGALRFFELGHLPPGLYHDEAFNGLDALKILENDQETFDLILTDLVMPNIGGVAIISIVKQKHPDIPVIAMTGWGDEPEVLASEAQADMVLGKPFKLDELDISIKQLILKNN